MGAAFQTYDFTLAAGGAIQIPATGSFFRVQSATGKVNVTAEFGALKGLGVGQGARSPFRILQIQDASGSANVGTIIVGDAEFVDDRISGEVSVIDGEKFRTLAGQMLLGTMNCAAVVAQYGFTQLWNPSASGKNLIVQQLSISANAIALICNLSYSSVALPNDQTSTYASNKKSGASIGVAQIRNGNSATFPPAVFYTISTPANDQKIWKPSGNIVVTQGQGLLISANQQNATMGTSIEWFEEGV